jgi:hypothetical protein
MAQWKKVLVSGSIAELSHLTASNGVKFYGLPTSNGTTPLVIDQFGVIATGSAYAPAVGGNNPTVGGTSLASNVAIIGVDNTSLIQTASSTQNVDFNTANLKNITELTASKAIFNTIALSGSFDGTGSSANLFDISFSSTESAALTIPSTTLSTIDFKPKITLSDVPGGSNETKVLMLDSSNQIITRSSGDIGGVTSVAGGDNLNVNQTTANVTVNLDSNLSGIGSASIDRIIVSTDITSSGNLFFTSSDTNKRYRIDFAKVQKADGTLELSSGSLEITASGLQVSGNVDLDGVLSFNGFNFTDSAVVVRSGSTQAGSGSEGAEVQGTFHQFTGSVLITGSNLTLVGGTLTIPNNAGDGTINVASVLADTATATNVVTNGTFNSAISSIGTVTQSLLASITSIGTVTSSLLSSITTIGVTTQSLLSSITSIGTVTSSLLTSITSIGTVTESLLTSTNALNIFSGSITSSVQELINFSGSISQSIQFDSNNNVNILNNLTVTKDLTVTENLIVNKNLTVNGTTTTFNTNNLAVEDRFIILGSGSSQMDDNLDVGIIFESGSQNGSGLGLFFDQSANRLAIGKNLNNIDFTASADGDLGTAFNVGGGKGFVAGNISTVRTIGVAGTNLVPSVGNHDNSNVLSASFGEGEMVIDSNNDLWFYVQ